MIKYRFYNAVDFSVRQSTLLLNKNTLIDATQNLIGNITLKPTQIHSDFVFSTIAAPSLLRASKMSFDEFILFGTPKTSSTHPQTETFKFEYSKLRFTLYIHVR